MIAPAPALGKNASVRVERAGQKRAVYFTRARVVGDSLLGRGDDAARLPAAMALADNSGYGLKVCAPAERSVIC